MYIYRIEPLTHCLSLVALLLLFLLFCGLAAMKLSREQQQWEHAQHDWEHWRGRVQDEIEAAQVRHTGGGTRRHLLIYAQQLCQPLPACAGCDYASASLQ